MDKKEIKDILDKATSQELDKALGHDIISQIATEADPNIEIARHTRLLKYSWAIGCVLCLGSCLYLYLLSEESRHQFTQDYEYLLYLPTVIAILLIFLGLYLQSIRRLKVRRAWLGE